MNTVMKMIYLLSKFKMHFQSQVSFERWTIQFRGSKRAIYGTPSTIFERFHNAEYLISVFQTSVWNTYSVKYNFKIEKQSSLFM